ncbi:MAG: hypothetical protein D6681_06530 [Calditrichaeota bacterium]|nr:MAG: hypothetical protein D6681_06530 [Calditrichota bacterium]
MSEPITEIQGRKPTEEERFYLNLAREEFAASLIRIEETAKYLIGAVGAVAGLVLAGMQVKIAVRPGPLETAFTTAFILWGISVLCAVLVFFPLPYRHIKDSPASIRRAFQRSRWVKWSLLLISALTFAAGLLIAALNL